VSTTVISHVLEGEAVQLKVLPSLTVQLWQGDVAFQFRTLANFDAWLESIDRQRAAFGWQPTLGVS
jgi:hypothetical protein